ncbi:hypothetical protein [Micromonospora sediminicola]|uniref:hypothetical protein n=1 Tax=Micromonospora sediminicola TaxID=946078 RepID=UPI0037908CBC
MAELSPVNATGSLTEAQFEALAHAQSPDGVIGHPDTAVFYKSGGQIGIPSFNALVRGFPYISTGALLSPDLTGAARTDLLVLRMDRANGFTIRAAIRKGTPGAGAPEPVMGTGATDVYELPLGEFDVSSGSIGALRLRAWFIGEDGQILVKGGVRPPHNPGRRIRETDTGVTWESTGVAWVKNLDDSGVSQAAIKSGWKANENYLQRRNGIVVLSLALVRTGTALPSNTNHVFGSLPAGFRPSFDVENTCLYWSGASPMNFRALKNGDLYVVCPAGDGVSQNRGVQGELIFPAA